MPPKQSTVALCAGSEHMMIRLVPKIFFDRMEDGLDLFVNCLGFTVLHQDASLAVVGRDGAKARPWGALEFSLLDKTGVCVVFRQWPTRA
jgi:hypothetical protein